MDPEKKIVKFPVWDLETDEIIEMEMDADDYEAMCKSEDEAEKKREEARQRDREETWESLKYARDD